MTSRIDAVVIDENLSQALEAGATLLTANRRLARAYSSAYDRQQIVSGNSAWTTPSIIPLETWWQTLHSEFCALGLSEKKLLSTEQQQAIWRNSIESSGDGGALLSINATAHSLVKAWSIQCAFDNGNNPWSTYLTQDQKAYQRWCMRFEALCDQGNFIDIGRLPDLILEVLAEHNAALNLLPKRLCLSGFLQHTPQLQRFLMQCRAYGVEVNDVELPNVTPVQSHRIACHDTLHEIQSAAHWARSQFNASNIAHTADRCIAIVISDLHARRQQVQRIFDSVFFPTATPDEIRQCGRPFEISLGQALDQYSPVMAALRTLRLGLDGLQGTDIGEWLLSPYLAHADSEKNARSLFDVDLRARGFERIRLYQLAEANETPRHIRTIVEQMRKLSTSKLLLPSQWLKRLVDMLQVSGWPGDSTPQSEEFQAIEAWRLCLDELVQLDDLFGEVSAKRILSLVQELTRSRVFQVQTPHAPIQILGSLELIGLQFDAAWYTGFDMESWPQTRRATPFLPLQWQKEVVSPGASQGHELAHAKLMFTKFRGSAPETIFSHATTVNGNGVEPSAQIQALPVVCMKDLAFECSTYAPTRVYSSMQLEHISDHTGPPIDTTLPARGGSRLFEDQALCPFRSFAIHRLRIRPIEEPTLGIDARNKGNFFHEAMALFWSQTQSHAALMSLTEEALEQRIDECIDKAIEIAMPSQDRQRRFALLLIEKNRIRQVMQSWIHYYENPREPFSVEQIEQDSEVEFQSLKLRLKLDRMDQLAAGGRVIIDYKTGKDNAVSSWMDERITRAQLPLYAVLMENIHAACFAQVATKKQKYIGMASEQGLLPGLRGPNNESNSWDERLRSWQQSLALLAEEIVRGHAAVTPIKNACQYCELSPLCRIEKNAPQEQAFESEHGSV